MQTIELKKFGKILVSRSAGLEAFNAIRPTLGKHDSVNIDFDDILTVTPSWLDEFLINLADYIEANVELLPTNNASVLAALPVLGMAREDKVAAIVQRAMDWIKKDNR